MPCDITTSGKARPSIGPLNATGIVVGPMVMDFGVAWLGYQMPISSGLPLGSAAIPCWNPAPWAHVAASAMATVVKAEKEAIVHKVLIACRMFFPDVVEKVRSL
ncbi:hypothetical protein GCM10008020_23860 [Massilia psychrophila]|nr:hypothetical protein GCM10008020_23860 [Massilia psychrophila]